MTQVIDLLPNRVVPEDHVDKGLVVAPTPTPSAIHALGYPGTAVSKVQPSEDFRARGALRATTIHTSLRRRFRKIATATNQKIFVASVVIGISIIGVKFLSMMKDLVVAATFGANDALDAYLMAFVLPALVINLIAGSFQAALVPTYIETRDQFGQVKANDLLGSTMLISIGLLCAVTALLALLGPYVLPFLASGFGTEKLALTHQLFYLLMPCIAFSGVATLWSSALNAEERFALAEVSQVAVPICTAVAIILGANRWGVYALTVGFVIGFFVQACILACGLRRARIPLVPRWKGCDPATMRVIGQYLPMLGGGLLLGTHPLIDQSMAATLGSGSVAALGYGSKVVALVSSLGAGTIGTAVLPYFSRMIAAKDIAAVRHTVKTFGGLILIVTVPISVLLIVSSHGIVRVIFERGAFTEADTDLVALVQAMATLQIPFYILGILFVRLLSSMKANHILMIGTAISFAINLVLDYVLKEVMGVAGIALATSIVYACSLAFLAVMLYRRLAAWDRATSLQTASQGGAG